METLQKLSDYIIYLLLLYGLIGFFYSLKYTRKINRIELFKDKIDRTITRWVSALLLSLLFIIFSIDSIHILWLYPLLFLLSYTTISFYVSHFIFIFPVLRIFHSQDMRQEVMQEFFGVSPVSINKRSKDNLSLGEKYATAGVYAKAIKYFIKFSEENPNDFRPYSALGFCNYHLIPPTAGWIEGNKFLLNHIKLVENSIIFYEMSIQILIDNHLQIDEDFHLINFDLLKIIDVYRLKLFLYSVFMSQHTSNQSVKPSPFNRHLFSCLLVYTGGINQKYDSLIDEIETIQGANY